MVKRHIIGRVVSDEVLDEFKQGTEKVRSADKLNTVEITPTMQTGYNEDGTIKEEKIQHFMYELDNKKER